MSGAAPTDTVDVQGHPSAGSAPAETVDVLVVGGRCAGAPLAAWLARAGASVIVADRASFPSDTLSTHVFQGGAIASLSRLGALDAVLATGAPGVTRGRVRIETDQDLLEAEVPMPVPAPGLPAMLCVRRVALDEVLHRTAADAGATMLDGWKVTDLVEEEGRIAGARLVRRDGDERTIRARVVVGADGRASTVARLVGASDYAVIPMERFGYFAYYEGVPAGDPPMVEIVRDQRLYGFGIPADAGLFLACVMPPAGEYKPFVADVEGNWDREVARLHGVGERWRSVSEWVARAGCVPSTRSCATRPARDGRCSATRATSRTRRRGRASPTRCARPKRWPKRSWPGSATATSTPA